MKSLKECFNAILHGNKNDSRLAARKVRKLLYSSQLLRDTYDDFRAIIDSAPSEYAQILEEWRQENFVVAISVIYFMHKKEEQPDFLFPWLFHLLQHPNGVIRYAAVRMTSHEIGPLTVHIRFPGNKHFDKLMPEQADSILHSLSINLNRLLSVFWKPIYKKYKYIDSLPAGPYKSVQMILARLEELCEKE